METFIKRSRKGIIICLAVIICFVIAPVIYADTDDGINANAGAQTAEELKLTQTYPEDKDAHLQIENTGIKLFFDGNVTDESVWKNNQECFKLTSKKGKAIKTKAYSSKKAGTDYILVVVEQGQTLASNSDYVFTISKGLKSAEGKVFAEDKVLNYQTVDMDGNIKINMGLMGLMVVGIIAMTAISNKRKERKEDQKKEGKVNPYKVAKEKGKSVEEVVEKIEKDKAKRAKRLKGKGEDSKDEDEDHTNVYHVKKLRKVSDGGSTYKSGRKAAAEKKVMEAAARKAKGTTNPKKGASNSKKRGKKKK